MSNVIGLKDTIRDRLDNWNAMLVFKKSYIELKDKQEFRDLAYDDKARYTKFLTNYIKEAA